MRYLIIWNGHEQWREEVRVKNWLEFLKLLEERVQAVKEPPDLIYLISIKE